MAIVIMDSKCHQAIREQGTEDNYYGKKPGQSKGKRLTGLRDSLGRLGHRFEIRNIEHDKIDDACVLIIAGRSAAVPFLDPELDKIAGFSRNGGVLLMANHPGKFVQPQNQVADRLNLAVEFLMKEGLSKKIALLPHAISTNCDELDIRRFCQMSVSPNSLTTVIAEHSNARIGAFAVAIDSEDDHSRVVAVGSSGHISSYDDKPLDLFSSKSNCTWTMNMISWLQYADRDGA